MIVQVELLAFGRPGEIREVDVPQAKASAVAHDIMALLDLVFMYGQNDFQPRQQPSVSVGDVIRLAGKRYRVAGCGFEEVK